MSEDGDSADMEQRISELEEEIKKLRAEMDFFIEREHVEGLIEYDE